MKSSNVKIGSPNSAFTPVKSKNDETQLPVLTLSDDYPDPGALLNNRKNAFAFVKNLFHQKRDSKICCVN
jgi:hypothetical protein